MQFVARGTRRCKAKSVAQKTVKLDNFRIPTAGDLLKLAEALHDWSHGLDPTIGSTIPLDVPVCDSVNDLDESEVA